MKRYTQVIFLLALLLTGCSNNFNDLKKPIIKECVDSFDGNCYKQEQIPPKLIKNEFSVKILDENNNPITDAKVIVIGNLSTSIRPYKYYPEEEKTKADNDGTYKFDNFIFDSGSSNQVDIKVSKDNWSFSKKEYIIQNIPQTKLVNFYKPSGKIVYEFSSEINVINGDGAGKITLSGNGIKPVWSPDNTKIAYISQINGENDLFTINPDGTERREIYSNIKDSWVSWSPDSKKLLFEANSSDRKKSQVSIINIDGTNLTHITELSDMNRDPSWSPDGKKIVYVIEKDLESNLCLMDPDGTNTVVVTNSVGYNNFKIPKWSPDSSKIVYLDQNNRALITSALGKRKNIVIGSGVKDVPRWFPDSSGVSLSMGYFNSNGNNDQLSSSSSIYSSWSSGSKNMSFISNVSGVNYLDVSIGNYSIQSTVIH